MLTKVEIIVENIEESIENKVLSIGDQIPSLTTTMKEYGVSRDTVVRAYRELNNRGIIGSVHGKGYFVTNKNIDLEKNLFILLDELSSYKNTLVKSIKDNLKNRGQYTIFFHHYNADMFQSLIEQHLGKFTHYVISPFPNSTKVRKSLELLPESKLILLDRHDGQQRRWKFIGQEFYRDIGKCLLQLKDSIKKYRRFIFVFPEPSFHPQELRLGFKEYCQKQGIEWHIVPNTTTMTMKHLDAYLVIDDLDLASIVKNSRKRKWRLGQDTGLISYNETPLKSVVSEGITTISTDFELMGKQLVEMVCDSKITNIHNVAKLIQRNSF